MRVTAALLCALLLTGCATTRNGAPDVAASKGPVRTSCVPSSGVAAAGGAAIDLGGIAAGLATFWWPVGLIALGAQGLWWTGSELICLATRPSLAEVAASPPSIERSADDGWGWEIPPEAMPAVAVIQRPATHTGGPMRTRQRPDQN